MIYRTLHHTGIKNDLTCRPAVESCKAFILFLFNLENTVQTKGIKSWNETVQKHSYEDKTARRSTVRN